MKDPGLHSKNNKVEHAMSMRIFILYFCLKAREGNEHPPSLLSLSLHLLLLLNLKLNIRLQLNTQLSSRQNVNKYLQTNHDSLKYHANLFVIELLNIIICASNLEQESLIQRMSLLKECCLYRTDAFPYF